MLAQSGTFGRDLDPASPIGPVEELGVPAADESCGRAGANVTLVSALVGPDADR